MPHGEEAAMENLRFGSYIAAAGQEDLCSHVESITFTNRIIRFPRGTETIIVYCPPPLFPLNDGISLPLLHFRGKRESLGERKGRYGTEQRCGHQPTGGGPNRKKQRPLSGSLFKPPNYPGLHPVAVKGRRASSVRPCAHSSPAIVIVSTLFKLVKSWYMENDIKPPAFQARDFICHGTGSCT